MNIQNAYRKLGYVACLCALLVGVQARALLVQVGEGFKPFRHPPSRVPFSWDMFAIKIERCTVAWDPPLSIEGKRVARWQDRGVPLEFDSVFNEATSYGDAAKRGCAYKVAQGTTARVDCAYSDGQVHELTVVCP